MNLPDFFIIGKYVKIRFKNRCHHAIFSVLEAKISKILQQLSKRDCFCIHTWFNFSWRFSHKTDLHTSIDLTLCLAHCLEFMRKDDLNVHLFQNRNWCSPKPDKKIIIKKIWGYGVNFWKNALYAELNERMEAATSSYNATHRFLQYIREVLCKKE